MSTFNVFTLVDLLDEEGMDTVIHSFAPLYKNVTPKHKKRMRLILVGTQKNQYLEDLVQKEKLSEVVTFRIIGEAQTHLDYLDEASVFLAPYGSLKRGMIKDCFQQGVPIITYLNEYVKEYIDHSCGMLIRYRTMERAISEFSEKLHMLYFDPEVRKILKKGALASYHTHFTWGHRVAAASKSIY